MDEQRLFEIAAKLHNVRPDQLRLKKCYLDVVVIETMDGAKFTYFVADLVAMVADGAPTQPPPAAGGGERPQHTRKR
jgi:hypothetical protein